MGLAQVNIQKLLDDGKTFIKNGKRTTFFTSCSYVGLENDPRLYAAAKEAIDNFGIQFSSSRAYLEIPLYPEMESLLSEIFGSPTLLAPTTTLGHMSLIPLFVGKNDAVIIDQQAHSSIQTAMGLVKGSGTHIEFVRHNRMDKLADKVKSLKDKHDKVWYFADGIYSMFGNAAPIADLQAMLDLYENFHVYIDDAHGMSWDGIHGSGYVLSRMPLHERMVFITTLAKGFGVAGSAMVFKNEEIKRTIRNVSPALMFSGPIQPANLGALIASAKIHLSDEIYARQTKVKDLIHYFNLTAKSLKLPLVGEDKTPIFFIGVGTPESGYEACRRMLARGYFLNIAVYPAVPYKNTGLRITVTHHITKTDIYEMLNTLAEILADLEKEWRLSKAEIFKAFAMPQPA
jgi:7-keto-8-aminopelargonate synthetase-like enzyme